MARKRARSTTVGKTKSDSEASENKAVEVSSKQDAEPATNRSGEPHPSELAAEDVEEMNVSSSVESSDNSDEGGDDDSHEREGNGEDEEDDDSEGDVRDFRRRARPKRTPASADDDADGVSNDKEGMEFVSDGTYRNKQRVLLFSSRGITSRFRHLMADLRRLIPHHKKDVKLDVGRDESLSVAVNEIAEIKSCNSCVFLECRKKTDLYLWAGKTPNGPSVKFHVLNVHTMDELKLTGNSMLGSRPLLNFDAKFDKTPHWKVMKGILADIFNTPRGHPKSKPFIDRIMSFFITDGKVWVRNYQIVDKGDGSNSALNRKTEKRGENNGSSDGSGDAGMDPLSLVEMGPRFVLDPIRVFAGSFGGPTLYNNGAYVSPNVVRSAKKRQAGARFEDRHEAKKIVKEKKAEPAVPRGPLDDVFM